MIKGGEAGKTILKKVYSEVKPGGKKQQKNFDDALDENEYWTALSKIENNVSKGRFAQRFASNLTIEIIPEYIKDAITSIITKVTKAHE
jgi:putative ATP-dependent endonuclease of OLD family